MEDWTNGSAAADFLFDQVPDYLVLDYQDLDYPVPDYQVPADQIPDASGGRAFAVASALMGAVLVGIMLVCGAGNFLFLADLVRSRRLRVRTDLLVANLALSDALVAAACCPFLLDYYVVKRLSWDHGLALCAATNYLRTVSLHVSTNALLAIAVDRYMAIVHPLRPRMKRRTASGVVLAVWAVPAFVSVPAAYMASETRYPHVGGDWLKTFCAQIWPVDQQLLYRSYFLLVFALQFLGPVAAMSVCYARICRELWFKDVPGFQTEQIRRRLRKRRRTVAVLILVLVAYVLCWLPYYSYSLLRDFYPTLISRDPNALVVFYVIECVAMSNGVINTLCFVSVRRRSACCRRRSARIKGTAKFPVPRAALAPAKSAEGEGEGRTDSLRVTEDAEGAARLR